jgi:hypothetical protein
MLNEDELRRLARERLRQGKLPAAPRHRVWAEPGAGESCDLCDLPISPDEVLYRVELLDEPGDICCRFHSACHAFWQMERRAPMS